MTLSQKLRFSSHFHSQSSHRELIFYLILTVHRKKIIYVESRRKPPVTEGSLRWPKKSSKEMLTPDGICMYS